jgi:multiple sugar transport system permease protein
MTTVDTTASRRASARRLRRGTEAAWAYAMVAPATIGLGVLYLWPLIGTLYLSFTKTGPFGGETWIGAGNYQELAQDANLLDSIANSLSYTGIVLLGVPLAVVLAALMNQVRRGRALYRVIYFVPVVTLPVAIGMVWRFIYNGDFGLLNYLLGAVGLPQRYWVSDPDYALLALAVVGIWMSLGTNMIILSAGLTAVPKEMYEAAELDGAGPVRQFFRITVPMLTPSIFFVTVLSVISALQMFDVLFVMLGGNNPALGESRTIVYLFYQKAFVENDRGYAAAIAGVLLVIIMLATAVQFRLQKRWVFYG